MLIYYITLLCAEGAFTLFKGCQSGVNLSIDLLIHFSSSPGCITQLQPATGIEDQQFHSFESDLALLTFAAHIILLTVVCVTLMTK